MSIVDALASGEILLAEGSMYDRLKRAAGECFDEELAYLGLIYSDKGRTALRQLVSDYIAAGTRTNHSMLIFTPTWRANADRIPRSPFHDRDVNREAVEFTMRIRAEAQLAGRSRVYIGGLTGCRNDCYSPNLALAPPEAEQFHRPQIHALADTGVDLLFASTLPAVSEAFGIAKRWRARPFPTL